MHLAKVLPVIRSIRIARVALAMMTLVFSPSLALAQQPDPTAAPSELTVVEETRTAEIVVEVSEPQPAAQQRDPGTHFIVELNLGLSLSGSIGFAGGLLVGAGGKLKGFPPIFYVIAEAGYLHGGSDGTVDGGSYQDARDYGHLSLGLRIYVPVHEYVRLFADVLGGATSATASFSRDGFSDLRSSAWNAHFIAGLGVQARIFREISAGVRATVLYTGDGLGELREALGISNTPPIVLSGSVTWHF
jgi:hypothetical protein